MGWDDSDDDEDEDAIAAQLQAQLKEREKERRREEGLDSESEEEEKAEEKPKEKPKPKPKVDKKKKEEVVEEPVLDAKAERARRKKLVEEADARNANDLFAGFEKTEDPEEQAKKEQEAQEEEAKKKAALKPKIVKVDAFDSVHLKVQADVDHLCEQCVNKVNRGKCKDGAHKFLLDLVKQLEASLSLKELGEVEKALADIVKEKKVQKGAVDAKANKANTKCTKTTKFNAASEWEEVYGGGDGDEEWTQEEWDEWYKQQEAGSAPAKK
mmetsp:Transcript_5620/g.11154  ORF Transcript_5620/g.11154 Transcript_5620/m.11154 type:complete len:269 (-) Transcript_5620:56-862(-)